MIYKVTFMIGDSHKSNAAVTRGNVPRPPGQANERSILIIDGTSRGDALMKAVVAVQNEDVYQVRVDQVTAELLPEFVIDAPIRP